MKLYLLDGGGYVKIGIARNIYKRICAFQGGLVPFDVTLRMVMVGDEVVVSAIEKAAIASLPGRANGEWFRAQDLPWQVAAREVRKIATKYPAQNRPQTYSGKQIAEVFCREIANAADAYSENADVIDLFSRGKLNPKTAAAMTENALKAMGYKV